MAEEIAKQGMSGETGFEVTLPAPKDVVIAVEQRKTITKFTINRMVDLPKERIVRIFIDELNDPIVLWEGDAYDNIGNWTNDDIDAKLKDLYK